MVKDDTLLYAGLGIAALYLLNKPLKDVGEGVASTIGGVGGGLSTGVQGLGGGIADISSGVGTAFTGVGSGIGEIGTSAGGFVGDVLGDVSQVTGGVADFVTGTPQFISDIIGGIVSSIGNLFSSSDGEISSEPVTGALSSLADPNQFQSMITPEQLAEVQTQSLASSSSKSVKSSSSEPTILTVYNEGGNTIAKATGGDLGVSKYTGNPIVEVIKVTTPTSSKSSSSKSSSSSSSVAYKGKTYSIKSSPSGPAIGSSASLQKTKDNIAKSQALTKAKYG